MKSLVIISVLFLTSCAGKESILKDRDGGDVIYEGVGFGGLKLGDDSNRITELLSKYSCVVFTNDYINYFNIVHHFGFMHYFIHGGNIKYFQKYPDLVMYPLLYHTQDFYLFDQPFFATVYVYYDLGVEIFLNEKGHIVEFIFYFNSTNSSRIPFDEKDLEKAKPLKTMQSFNGWLDKLSIDPSSLKKDGFLNLIRQSDFLKIQYDTFYFFKGEGTLFAVSIISPIIGGEKNISLMSFQLSSHDIDVIHAGKEWQDKYGECYIRPDE